MKRRTIYRILLSVLAMALMLSSGATSLSAMAAPPDETAVPAFGPGVLKPGAKGKDVNELQGRLKLLGFYTGPINGVFTHRTYLAVRLFQYRFGLKVDGSVGPKTKLMLWKATKHWTPSMTAPKKQIAKKAAPATGTKLPRSSNGFSQNDLKLLAQAVYAEGRGEPYVGQVAIASVILNRIESDKFPDTVSGIIFQPLAFEAVADGQIWMEPDETAKKAVMDAVNGWDPSGGALYYFNPERATSKWIWSRPQIKTIGKHIFCR
jgi:N-acetylmuramoyl-L-alanine amidase